MGFLARLTQNGALLLAVMISVFVYAPDELLWHVRWLVWGTGGEAEYIDAVAAIVERLRLIQMVDVFVFIVI